MWSSPVGVQGTMGCMRDEIGRGIWFLLPPSMGLGSVGECVSLVRKRGPTVTFLSHKTWKKPNLFRGLNYCSCVPQLSPEKMARWRAVLKSITVPSGLFVTLAGFILFMKRFPNCGVAQILSGLRAHHPQATNPPRINVQVSRGGLQCCIKGYG